VNGDALDSGCAPAACEKRGLDGFSKTNQANFPSANWRFFRHWQDHARRVARHKI
jgi:hypothetical protein